MSLQTLQELESKLISQGYSRRYAQRLADELLDHSLEMAQDQSGHGEENVDASLLLPPEIGTIEVLTEAVKAHQELDPLPRKFPFAFFVLVPVVMFNLWQGIFLTFIYESNLPQPLFTVGLTNAVYYLSLTLLPLLGLWATVRYRIPISYLLLLTLGLALSSLFGTTAVTCRQTQSVFVHSGWGFHWWQFLLPILSLSLGLIAFRHSFVEFPDESGVKSARSRQHQTILITRNIVLFAFLLVVSGEFVTQTLERVRKHPVDNLIQGFNSEDARGGRVLAALKNRKLNLEESKANQIQRILEHQAAALRQIYRQQDSTQHLAWKEKIAAANEISSQAFLQVKELLNEDQIHELERSMLKQFGWQAIFHKEVRNHIDMTAYQFLRFKDVHLSVIQRNQRLRARYRDASEQEKAEITKEITELKSKTDQQYAAILTDQQIEKFDRYCGTTFCSLAANQHVHHQKTTQ